MLLYNIYSLSMISTRAIKFSHLWLIVLMLLAQTAVAQHASSHLLHDASEYCKTYVSAEASKLLVSYEVLWNMRFQPQRLIDSTVLQRVIAELIVNVARGPPQHI